MGQQQGRSTLPTTPVPIGTAQPDGSVRVDASYYRYFNAVTQALRATKQVLVTAGIAGAEDIPDV